MIGKTWHLLNPFTWKETWLGFLSQGLWANNSNGSVVRSWAPCWHGIQPRAHATIRKRREVGTVLACAQLLASSSDAQTVLEKKGLSRSGFSCYLTVFAVARSHGLTWSPVSGPLTQQLDCLQFGPMLIWHPSWSTSKTEYSGRAGEKQMQCWD